MAPAVGFEPTALRLTAECSTIELRRTSTLEAEAGIEPTYTDLQSAASPLCHSAETTFNPTAATRTAERRFIEAQGGGVKRPSFIQLGCSIELSSGEVCD